MVKVYYSGQIQVHTKDNSLKAIYMEKEHINGKMEDNLKVITITISWKVMASSHG